MKNWSFKYKWYSPEQITPKQPIWLPRKEVNNSAQRGQQWQLCLKYRETGQIIWSWNIDKDQPNWLINYLNYAFSANLNLLQSPIFNGLHVCVR